MFTKYHNFFLSSRFFFKFSVSKQTKTNQVANFTTMHVMPFVRPSTYSFIHSFIHASMHSFIQVPGYTLHIKFLCQNFLQHNVVA